MGGLGPNTLSAGGAISFSLRSGRGKCDLLAARTRESGEIGEKWSELEGHLFLRRSEGHRLCLRQFHLVRVGIQLDASSQGKRGNLIGALRLELGCGRQ